MSLRLNMLKHLGHFRDLNWSSVRSVGFANFWWTENMWLARPLGPWHIRGHWGHLISTSGAGISPAAIFASSSVWYLRTRPIRARGTWHNQRSHGRVGVGSGSSRSCSSRASCWASGVSVFQSCLRSSRRSPKRELVSLCLGPSKLKRPNTTALTRRDGSYFGSWGWSSGSCTGSSSGLWGFFFSRSGKAGRTTPVHHARRRSSKVDATVATLVSFLTSMLLAWCTWAGERDRYRSLRVCQCSSRDRSRLLITATSRP